MIIIKKTVKEIFKIIVAGILALIILSVFSFFYYNNGIRQKSRTGATDYTWENKFWSLGYEGFAWGFYDADGFNNVAVCKAGEMSLLLMGSSQMNAYNVMPNCSVGYILNDLFQKNGVNKNVYNIGIEGHDFYTNADNLERALNYYQPTEYTIIQINTVNLNEEKVQGVIDGTRIPSEAFDTGIIYYMQKIPYLRLLYKQIRDFNSAEKNTLSDGSAEKMDHQCDKKLQDDFLKKMESTCEKHGVKLVLVYMPAIYFDSTGTMCLTEGTDAIEYFSKNCEENGIKFINVGECFIERYEKERIVPYGFSNTVIGKGHLNKYGHDMVAHAIYNAILEEKK